MLCMFQVINKVSNVTEARYRVTMVVGDLSTILGPSGKGFCADLGIYAVYPDQTPQQEDIGTGNPFQCLKPRCLTTCRVELDCLKDNICFLFVYISISSLTLGGLNVIFES